MPRTKLLRRTVNRRRIAVALSAAVFVAHLALFIGHHHPNEADSGTCLVCSIQAAPALPCECGAGMEIRSAAAPFSCPESDPGFSVVEHGAKAARSPPSR